MNLGPRALTWNATFHTGNLSYVKDSTLKHYGPLKKRGLRLPCKTGRPFAGPLITPYWFHAFCEFVIDSLPDMFIVNFYYLTTMQ